MQATIRRYAGRELADLLDAHRSDVETLISGVSGVQGYFLIRTEEGCASVTVCDDQAGIDESTRLARDWIRENATGAELATPEIITGEVMVHIGAAARA